MIQPIDIKTQKFKKGLFGYSADAVDSFVDTVYRAYDELFNENKKTTDELDKLNASLQEYRLKIFDLENKVNSGEGGSFDDSEAKAKADKIIKDAEAKAADIIAKAKRQASSGEKTEPEATKIEIKDEFKESAASRFFKKTEEEVKPQASAMDEDDDEIFVGEIEDARKPDRMMIGDGEEEEEADFEFL